MPRNDDDTETRIHHNPTGWTIHFLSPHPQDCTTNHTSDHAGQPPCPDTAVWKVVELRCLNASVGFWCTTHLPAEYQALATA